MKSYLKIFSLVFISLFFAGCGETLYYSKYEYFPKNSEKEIRKLPIFEDVYYDYNGSKVIFSQKAKKPVFKLKKVYNGDNSYVKITSIENDNTENRDILKLYDNFYLTKRFDKENRLFVYSVVEMDGGIISLISVKNDYLQQFFKDGEIGLIKTKKPDNISLLIKKSRFDNFKKFLVKSLKEFAYRRDEHKYYINFQKRKNDIDFVKKIVKDHPEAVEYLDKKIALKLIKDDPKLFQYANMDLKRDKRVVLSVVKRKGSLLDYADDSLKKDKDIVLAALKEDAGSIRFVDKSYQDMAFKNFEIDRKKLGEKLADTLLSFRKVSKENERRLKKLFSKVDSKVDYDFKMRDIYGNDIKIKIVNKGRGLKIYPIENKIVILDFFGTRSYGFMDTRYLYAKLKERYEDDLEILSFAVNKTSIDKLKEIALKSRSKNIIIPLSEQSYKFIRFIQKSTRWDSLVPFALFLNKKHYAVNMLLRDRLAYENGYERACNIVESIK